MGSMDEPDTFNVEMQSDANDVLRVVLDGELDMADADWVEESLAAAAPHHRCMVIELDKLTFIDSTGIRALLALRQRANVADIAVQFRNPTKAVSRTLTSAGLTEILST